MRQPRAAFALFDRPLYVSLSQTASPKAVPASLHRPARCRGSFRSRDIFRCRQTRPPVLAPMIAIVSVLSLVTAFSSFRAEAGRGSPRGYPANTPALGDQAPVTHRLTRVPLQERVSEPIASGAGALQRTGCRLGTESSPVSLLEDMDSKFSYRGSWPGTSLLRRR